MALLLALLFGALTGGSLSPVQADAQPASVSALSKRAVLAASSNEYRAAVKAQRHAPDLATLPPSTGVVRTWTLRPSERLAAQRAETVGTIGAAAYHARAPPAA